MNVCPIRLLVFLMSISRHPWDRAYFRPRKRWSPSAWPTSDHLSPYPPCNMASRQITFAEVCEHKTEESLWIIIDNKGMFHKGSDIQSTT